MTPGFRKQLLLHRIQVGNHWAKHRIVIPRLGNRRLLLFRCCWRRLSWNLRLGSDRPLRFEEVPRTFQVALTDSSWLAWLALHNSAVTCKTGNSELGVKLTLFLFLV